MRALRGEALVRLRRRCPSGARTTGPERSSDPAATAERSVAVRGALVRAAVLVAALLLAGAPARAGDDERLEQLFAPGRALSLQLVFDQDGEQDDWCMNGTVGDITSETLPDGRRALVVTTASYVVNDLEHAFVLRLAGGKLARVDLVVQEGDQRRPVPQAVFRFEPADLPGGAEATAGGELTLTLRGTANRGRGREQRGRALFALRSFAVEGAPALSY